MDDMEWIDKLCVHCIYRVDDYCRYLPVEGFQNARYSRVKVGDKFALACSKWREK